MTTLFEGFETHDVDVDGVAVHAVTGGEGPPVLLLHGYPQTHAMWHRVAPALARRHTVVAADLRGYGDSGRPADEPGHAAYAKRAMAADLVGLMRRLGFDRFAVAGHDRGARVTHRMCLDHPERVTRAAVLDILPTRHMFATTDRALAQGYYHWFFLAQPDGLPERLIGGDPEYYLRTKLGRWSAEGASFDPRAVEEYVRCFRDPASVHATCEDYRAAGTVDLEHDEADAAAGRRVDCPLLVLWGTRGFVASRYDVAAVWRDYAADVRGAGLDCGHFLAEEAPEETARALADFLAE
ncbi:alpha/beta hydrolase [Streptomyces sp. B1866]|uniref:alpha/beta fold hydrolase n=1 Tax=Streptomyces sp. B1866 TaxID=3075431 RepID=UPI0028905423|nr:alpha/beta hydrolase [Streptomyces sp. B1866]MDT3399089.1 alpha/beta hydrolase [Streptomyces sp. B1866]